MADSKFITWEKDGFLGILSLNNPPENYLVIPDFVEIQQLKEWLSDDIRALTGRQAFVKEAPINLVYVSDYAKFEKGTEEDKLVYSAADTGFISQNVYLYCASEGLATVVRVGMDKPALAKTMKLRPEQKIILAQSVGYPRKK